MKLLLIPIIAAFVIAGNYYIVSKTKSEAWLAEVGFYSNVSRLNLLDISQKVDEQIDLLLIGSSITGRILPHFFSEEQNVINLGMDAGGTPSSLEFVLRNVDLEKINKLVLEVNTLTAASDKDAERMFDERDTFTYDLGLRLPFLRPLYRPSSVFYYKLKSGKDKQLEYLGRASDKPFNIREKGGEVESVEHLLQAVLETGKEVVLVKYPSSAQPSEETILVYRLYAEKYPSIDYIEVPYKLYEKNLVFTDKVHLTLGSSKKVACYLESKMLE